MNAMALRLTMLMVVLRSLALGLALLLALLRSLALAPQHERCW